MKNEFSGTHGPELPEFDSAPVDPIALMREWFKRAAAEAVSEPTAMVISTVSKQGAPSSRVVSLKEIDQLGRFVFGTSDFSLKARQLATNSYAALTFYWRETMQQLNISGPVHRLTDIESDNLFASRPVSAQAATVVSQQSDVLQDEDELRKRAISLSAPEKPLTRPSTWSAYGLVPEQLEFWHGQDDRLHRRLSYTKKGSVWVHSRLQP